MVRRPFMLSVLLVGLAAAIVLSACGGGGSDTAPPVGRESALSVSQPGELTALVRETLRRRHAQRVLLGPLTLPTATTVDAGAAGATARSSTLTQEDGVGEADLLISDGATHFFTQQPGATANALRVSAWRRAVDGSITALPELTLAAESGAIDFLPEGLYRSDNGATLLSLGRQWTPAGNPCAGDGACLALPHIGAYWLRDRVSLHWIDATDPAALAASGRVVIDGALVDTRRIGDTVVVVSTHRPQLKFELLPLNATDAEREAALAAITPADVLPMVTVNAGASQPLVGETECWIQPANRSLDLAVTTVSLIDLRAPAARPVSRCFIGGAEALYMSASYLYLATTRAEARQGSDNLWIYPADFHTDVHRFAIGATSVDYRASGSVRGHLGWQAQRKAWRFSEAANGDLRLLTFTGSEGWATLDDAARKAASPAALTVLRDDGAGALAAVATLPNDQRPAALGKPGEQVYGVRFAGERAYVVTFRVLDPLYVLDLSSPTDPRVAGELELPGFSDHLLPLTGGYLFGVGRQIDGDGFMGGLKATLFDVRDLAAPREVGSLNFGQRGSTSALDFSRHGLNALTVGSQVRLALPVFLVSNDGSDPVHGLQRIEADLGAVPALRERSVLPPSVGGADIRPGFERSLQVGDDVYYLSQGALRRHRW